MAAESRDPQVSGAELAEELEDRMEEELTVRFSYHPPKGDQEVSYLTIREHGHSMAELILDEVPQCRERMIALMKLEEAVMWANAGVARRSDPEDDT